MISLRGPEDHQISPAGVGVVLAVAFIIERIVLAVAGIRFNVEALTWYWQILDPVLLKEHLFESVFFLHAQPPLFNFVLGIALKLSPNSALSLLHGFYLALGLTLAITLYLGLLELHWNPRLAALTVAVAALTPGWIVYENWLFYDFPVMVLLAVAFVGFLRFRRAGRWGDFVLFVAAVALVALTRSLFHLLWALVSIGIVIAASQRIKWRPTLIVALLAVGSIAGWYGKNQAVFGFFGPSSWLGLSLAKTSTARLDPREREALVSQGTLSPFALVEPFSPLEQYESAAGIRFPDSEVAALGTRLKSTGHPNLNHQGFLQVSAQSQLDALEVIYRHPSLYSSSVSKAVRRFFTSAVAYPPFLENLVVIAPVFHLGQLTWSRPISVVLAFVCALVIAIVVAWKASQRGQRSEAAVQLWVMFTLMWVLVVGSLVEVGENHRFRFLLTPLIWLTLADGARRLSMKLQRKE